METYRSGLELSASLHTLLLMMLRRVSHALPVSCIAAISGTFIADSYARVTYPPVRCGDFSPSATACLSSEATVETHRASRHYLVGPSVEVHLSRTISVEGDALYGPSAWRRSRAACPCLRFRPILPGAFQWSASIGSTCPWPTPTWKSGQPSAQFPHLLTIICRKRGDGGRRHGGNGLEAPSLARGAACPLGYRRPGRHDLLRLAQKPSTILAGPVLLGPWITVTGEGADRSPSLSRNYSSRALRRQKRPNAYGLYDMLGNVWEWVQDRYEVEAGKQILRDGSFYNAARELRFFNRLWATPETAHRNMGVRCVGN